MEACKRGTIDPVSSCSFEEEFLLSWVLSGSLSLDLQREGTPGAGAPNGHNPKEGAPSFFDRCGKAEFRLKKWNQTIAQAGAGPDEKWGPAKTRHSMRSGRGSVECLDA
jgi:hypothetical protein